MNFFAMRDDLRRSPHCIGIRADIDTTHFLMFYPEENIFEYTDWNTQSILDLSIDDIRSTEWEVVDDA